MINNLKFTGLGFTVIAILALNACKPDSQKTLENKIMFNETQCSDAWEHNDDETIHKNNIIAYLLTQGIDAEDVSIGINPPGPNGIFCAACNCPNGIKIELFVADEDVAPALALGFYE